MGNYSGERDGRGGGKGGLTAGMNAREVSSSSADVVPAGRQRAGVAGMIKIAAVISESPLWWQQDIEQLIAPWCL